MFQGQRKTRCAPRASLRTVRPSRWATERNSPLCLRFSESTVTAGMPKCGRPLAGDALRLGLRRRTHRERDADAFFYLPAAAEHVTSVILAALRAGRRRNREPQSRDYAGTPETSR